MPARVMGGGLLAYPGSLAYQGSRLPAITDVTTDPIDPPRFEVVARLRPPNSSLYPGLAVAELQKEAWPDIEPLVVNVSPKAAYDAPIAATTNPTSPVVHPPPPSPNPPPPLDPTPPPPPMPP